MSSVADRVLDRWRRRYWRPDPRALAAFDGLNPVTVITGASEGIGLALARRCAGSGHALLLIARDAARLEAAADALRGDTNSKIETLALDLTTADALAKLDAALARVGAYPDILVNNAGVGLSGAFASHDTDALAALAELNVKAVTLFSRHVLPGQLIRGRGGIITIASLGGYAPGPGQAAYYASKAFVLSLSEALAAETAGHGVRVTAVAPGPVDTAFHSKMGANSALYRSLLPPLSADRVAAAAIAGFKWNRRVIVPGLVNKLLMMALRLLPHRITLPIVQFLLHRRGP